MTHRLSRTSEELPYRLPDQSCIAIPHHRFSFITMLFSVNCFPLISSSPNAVLFFFCLPEGWLNFSVSGNVSRLENAAKKVKHDLETSFWRPRKKTAARLKNDNN
ncbi:hypothetical protein FGF66_11775 [Chlorobaculum thiosulfatiphilum]|uniref:Uncharacterized protein n=1 Tax=Chlorobaculum thiosulfatiphilum TaxID=115852 RepID=A0A5C4RZ20_CHLTI|nr:hypothetical protein [Chlorobaculum thiosulfatiphilum]TNJ36546.1 hypothetical protein FGF66_11775 [Chlorobaculum thiosulfatiphilum]